MRFKTETENENAAHPNRATVAVVGLGETGRTLALALRRLGGRFYLIGHDREPELAKDALRAGALDKATWNLIDAVEKADMVVLAEPLDQLVETLGLIAPHLKAGALVTDTTGVKVPVLRAAAAALPPGISFVGGHPILRAGAPMVALDEPVPAGGGEAKSGEPDTPLAALDGATYCLVPLASAGEDAIRALANVVSAIGARPLFINAEEHDALVAGAGQLPYVLMLALARLVDRSPSQRDLLALVDPRFAGMVETLGAPGGGLADDLGANAGALVGWLDQAVAELGALRATLAGDDPAAVRSLIGEAAGLWARWQAGPMAPGSAAPGFDAVDERPGLRALFLGQRGAGASRLGK